MATLASIDLSEFKIDIQSKPSEEKLKQFGERLVDKFKDHGAVGLHSTGMNKELVLDVLRVHEKFYSCSEEERKKYSIKPNLHGYYVAHDLRAAAADEPHKFKKSFNTRGAACEVDDADQYPWPDDLSPGFSTTVKDFMNHIGQLTVVVLEAIALGLGLDKSFFTASHTPINSLKTLTTLGSMQTTPGPEAAHHHKNKNKGFQLISAYGTLGLLFTGKDGGIQFQNLLSGEFQKVESETTVYLYVGDALEVWTRQKLKAATFRSISAVDSEGNVPARQNLFCYVCGDVNSVVCDLHLDQGRADEIVQATSEDQMTVDKFVKKKMNQVLMEDHKEYSH